MAISESALKNTVLMLIDEQNAKGGVLGKKLEPVVVAEEPLTCVARGCGMALDKMDKLASIFTSE